MVTKTAHITLLGLLLLTSTAAQAATLSGRVVGVADGDTITVLDSQERTYKIRLSGIDAPEKAQAFGQVSKQSLSDLVYGKHVTVVWDKEDRYKRIVGKVLLAGADANLKQVARGLAWHYKKYANEQTPEDAKNYADTENAARVQRLGLWSDAHASPPWDWRKKKRARANTQP